MAEEFVDDTTPDDDCGDDEQLVAGGSVPVGITIALKGGLKEKISTNTKSSNKQSSRHQTTKKTKQKKKEKHSDSSSSFRMFLESTILYALCLILPTLIGYLYNVYEVWKYEQEQQEEMLRNSNNETAVSSAMQWLSDTYYQPTLDYMCSNGGGDSADETSTTAASSSSSYHYYSQYLSTSLVDWTGICPPDEASLAENKSILLSEDVTAWSDVSTIAVCSFFLAAIRILIVHYAVPMESIAQAMVRCKSVNLLSSEYIVTPAGTPQNSYRDIRSIPPEDAQWMMVPDLSSQNNSNNNRSSHQQQQDDDDDMFGVRIDNTERVEEEEEPISSGVLNEPDLMQSSSGRLPPPEPQIMMEEDEEPISFGSRKYAAPRFATALFRLLYSLLAVGIALYYFRDADFWPWYVLGHGNTAKCWDLSGGLTVGMDSDFDHRNTVLKRYFLWQASYHWHSGAFHVLSMLVLLLHPTTTDNRFLSVQKNTSNYIRRLAQHALAVALIAVAYIFSSLRRLGAIGLFAFDVSSSFLHLLQVCINAPEGSRWRQKAIVARVFWIFVIPSFVVSRFLIWPAIWYSATFESAFWLTQLEKTLWPGSAALLRGIFHFLMVIMQTFAVIYFRRLLNHPHLQGLRKRVKRD